MIDFTPDYYAKVIDLFHAKAVELEIFHNRFFELQAQISELSEAEQAFYTAHPDAEAMENNLTATLRILQRLRV